MKHKKIRTTTAILCIGTILCACGGKQATRQADETVEAAPKAPVIIETNHLNPGVQYGRAWDIASQSTCNPGLYCQVTHATFRTEGSLQQSNLCHVEKSLISRTGNFPLRCQHHCLLRPGNEQCQRCEYKDTTAGEPDPDKRSLRFFLL